MNDDLLVSYLLDEADADTRRQIEKWISEDEKNLRYFERFRLIWDTSIRIQLPPAINSAEAWQRFQRRIQETPAKTAIIKRISRYTYRLRIAAAVIVCIGILTLSYYTWNKIAARPVTFAALTEPKADTLPDGSVITLNKHSEITYPGRFSYNRKIKLKGEAFFRVSPDKSHPFIINVNDVTVTVVGTSFNIKTVNGNTEVIVETGIVKVEKNKKTITLTKGQKILVSARDSSLAKEATTDKLYNYYRTHEFVCDDTPLWKLVDILNQAYGSNIVIENKAIRNLPLTTTFHNEPLDKILAIISQTFNISIEHEGNNIILK